MVLMALGCNEGRPERIVLLVGQSNDRSIIEIKNKYI